MALRAAVSKAGRGRDLALVPAQGKAKKAGLKDALHEAFAELLVEKRAIEKELAATHRYCLKLAARIQELEHGAHA